LTLGGATTLYNLEVSPAIRIPEQGSGEALEPASGWRIVSGVSARNHLIAFLICLLLGVIFTLPGSVSPRSALLGYAGDNYQHAWFLWHFAHAISHAENPFYTNLIFYPNRVNLAWSTMDPLAGTLALPLSLAAGPALAYNLSLILQLALAAFFARLLCLRICRNETAALIGGVIFGFSSFLLAQALGHLSLVTAFPIPLFVLTLDAVLREQNPSWKLGIGLGLALLLTAFAHYNYTVLCVLFGFFMFAIETALEGVGPLKRAWKTLSVAVVTFFVGFLPLLRMLLRDPSGMPVPRGSGHFEQFSADALGFLIPSWNHILLGRFARGWNPKLFTAGFEGTVYIGPVVLALAVLGTWKGRREHKKWVVRASILGFLFYLLSLGPQIRVLGNSLGVAGPAALLYRIRFAEFISAPARFHVLVALCVAILSSLGVAFLIENFRGRWRQYALVALLAVMLLVDYLTVPFPRSSIVDPAAPGDTAAAQSCILPENVRGGTVLTFPIVIAPYCMKSMWMQASDRGQYALVDGYLSYTPERIWDEFGNIPVLRSMLALEGILNAPVDEASDRQSTATTIRNLNLRAVVVFDSPERDEGAQYVESVFNVSGKRAGSCTVFQIEPKQATAGK
jgi:hypothetical protein